MNNRIKTIIFSKDRAMQLDATLKSFINKCGDFSMTNVSVIYKATTEFHNKQYCTLQKEHINNNISFIEEGNLYKDTIKVLGVDLYDKRVNIARLFLSKFFLPIFDIKKCPEYVLFIVDDTIFIDEWDMQQVINNLEHFQESIGFSLRLGLNTEYCYPLDCSQSIPKYEIVDNNVILFRWVDAEADFGYPLEISSSIYRVKDILPLLLYISFKNPNELEGKLALKAKKFQKNNPKLLCYSKSVAFSNPINKVQDDNDNRFGSSIVYSDLELAQKYDSGLGINVNAFNNFIPNACHQEIGLDFIQR